MKEKKRLERLLRAVLLLSLLSLAILTPFWWRQTHPRPAAASAETPAPTPEATPDPRELLYREAEEAAGAGLYVEALAHWTELDGYADSAARAEECRERLYEAGTDCLLRRELVNAASFFRPLGDYRDALRWLRYCDRHMADTPTDRDLRNPARVYFDPPHGQGRLYSCSVGLYYLPNEVGPETQTLLYYPGGASMGEIMLDFGAVAEYIRNFAPDAVCFFAYENGFRLIDEHNRASWRFVETLLQDCSLVPHEIVLAGTSNGFYSVEHLALTLFEEEGLPVRTVLSFDTGEDWGERQKLLNEEELARLAQAGTRLELFEQRRFKTGRDVIQELLRAGLAVDLIECDNGDHEIITKYAFRLGALSWALGECELNAQQYVLTPLALEDSGQ